MDSYLEVLKIAYNRVVQLTIKDQSLIVLSSMDNKSFYFSRIHELFTQIYSVQRQNQIKLLLQQNQALKLKNSNSANIMQKGTVQYIEIPCKSCNHRNQDQIQNNAKLRNQDMSMKQTLHNTIKQNENLAKQLNQTNLTHLQEIKTFSTFNQITLNKLNEKISILNKELSDITDSYMKLKANYNNQTKNLEQTRINLQQQKQQNTKLVIKIREYQKNKLRNIESTNKLNDQINNFRQTKNLLEDKIQRLQEEKAFYKNKLQIYEKQVQNIEQLKQNCQNNKSQMKYKEEQDYSQIINRITASLALKQIQLKGLLSQKIKLNEQNKDLIQEFNLCKQNADKSIFELKQCLKRQKLQYQSQLRKYRDSQKQGLINLKKMQIESKIENMDNFKERIKKLEAQKDKLDNKIMKLEHTNQTLIKNYQQIAQAFKEEKSMFDTKVSQYQNKLDKIKRSEKESCKKYQLKEMERNSIEKQLTDKIRFYQQKIEINDEQLQSKTKSQQNLLKIVQKLEKQLRNRTNIGENQKLLLKQHQLALKVNQLQNLLMQNKTASQQLLYRKQERIKQLKTQLEDKCVRISQLNFKLNNQIEEKNHQQKILKQTQKSYSQVQLKLVQIQEKNRSQIVELMKYQQNQIQQITDNFNRQQISLASKSNVNQKYCINETLKMIQQDYQNKIKNLQNQLIKVKNKNNKNQQLLKESEQKLRISYQKLKSNSEETLQLRKKQNILQENLQINKNKQISIIRHYEQKISNIKNIFKQFKFQMCHQFKQVILQLRIKITELVKQTKKNQEALRKCIGNVHVDLQDRIFVYQNSTKKKLEQDCYRASDEKLQALQKEKEHLVIIYQNKLKQKHMDMMTLAAQKQFMVEQIKENQGILLRKYKELQNMYKKLMIKQQKSEKNENQLKNVILNMESKVDQAQKNFNKKQKQTHKLQMLVQELTQKLQNSDSYYKKQLKQCRQKYRQQNEKIFNRYEKQFTKIIALNSKKPKDKTSLTSISSMKGFSIPTKGNQQDKVQKLKKQIQQQKRIVAEMENQKRI